MTRAFLAVLLLACAWGSARADDAPFHIEAGGHVSRAGTLSLPATSRYSDASLAAAPTSDAYVLGAALLRPSLVNEQTRVRAGLLYDFGAIVRRAADKGDEAVATRAEQLSAWVASLPVTGRVSALLDARVAEVTPEANLPMADGDRLMFPARPSTVRIVGAVRQACEVAFVPVQDARLYLSGCPDDGVADRDIFFVIQPDGTVFRQGRAPWNRGESLALAPGAVLYVPLKIAATRTIDPALDDDMARFLATQVLP